MTINFKMLQGVSGEQSVALLQNESSYLSAINKIVASENNKTACELTPKEKMALNMYRQYDSIMKFRAEVTNRYWTLYLSAIEKRTLQAMSDEIIEEYELTEEEKRALAYFDSEEMRSLRR